MSTTFHLVRHGLKERRIGDVSLTSEGVLQAEATALHFAKAAFSVTKILTSPLRRAQETASMIARHTHTHITEDPRLRERANWEIAPISLSKNSLRCGIDAHLTPITFHPWETGPNRLVNVWPPS